MSSRSSNPLRIAVLAHSSRRGGGVSVAQNLIAALGRVGPQNRYLVAIPPGVGYEAVCDSIPFCEILPSPHSEGLFGSWFHERFQLPKRVNAFASDMVLSLVNRGLFNIACPQVLMLHCAYHFYPSKYHGELSLLGKMVVLYHRYHLRRILRRSSLVLCQTEVAERRIRDVYHYEKDMLVIPNSSSASIERAKDQDRVPEKLRPLDDKMKLFFLTEYFTHKNLEGIVQLFKRFRDELKDVVVIITIAPEQHPRAVKLLESIENLGLGDQIVNVGPVPQGELGRYYCNCQALLLPTTLESFTRTYVEAMFFGIPILTSDLDFAHAVCKDAALYFDPWRPDSIKDAILRLKNEPGLAEVLTARGRSVLEQIDMNWDDVAAALLDRISVIVDRRDPAAKG